MNTINLNVLGAAKAAAPGVSIKNQDKSVDITENGVTEVTAGSGYTGLGKVTINANVQGGGEGEGTSWRYFKLDEGWESRVELAIFSATMAKYRYNDTLSIGTVYAARSYIQNVSDILQFAFPANVKYIATSPGDSLMSFNDLIDALKVESGGSEQDVLTMLGMTEEITEEEFYNLEA